MLIEAVKAANLRHGLKSADGFAPFPRYNERDKWERLPKEIKAYYTGKAELLADCAWPILPATRYMDFYYNGNRSRYQKVYHERRKNLLALVLGECFAGTGEYLNAIIDGIWAICEETSWVVPAHNNHGIRPELKGTVSVHELPDIEEDGYIDLFSAETGSLLAWTHYFLGAAVAETAPLVTRRIELEVKRRLLDPYLEFDWYPWLGLSHGLPVNNWNPWINSNMLTAFLLTERDPERRLRGVEKTAASIERFIHFYADDGGCDEGPGYFGAAGASLFDYLHELYDATGGAVNIFGQEKIKNIAAYIYKVHIGGLYYVNFADAAARVKQPALLLARVGRDVGDAELTGFAGWLLNSGNTGTQYACVDSKLYRILKNITEYEQTAALEGNIAAPSGCWFEGIQVMTARERAGSHGGLFVAAKGGNNAESHNHNDIGSFILYKDGEPVIIDAGVEAYTKKTFSGERYEIWTMQSCYHNLPRINGKDQISGREARAEAVAYADGGAAAELSMELKAAYPAEASIKSYRRRLVFERGKSLTLTDKYELGECTEPLVMNLMCREAPVCVRDGEVKLSRGVTLFYERGLFEAATDEINLTDTKLSGDWGVETLYRLRLTGVGTEKTGEYTLQFKEGGFI